MIPASDRRTRAPRTTEPPIPNPPPIAKPIERIGERVMVKVIKELCPYGCGYVEFKVRRTSGDRRTVWCPKCGKLSSQRFSTDTIRPITDSVDRPVPELRKYKTDNGETDS